MTACATTYTSGPPCQFESVGAVIVLACVHEHFRAAEVCRECLQWARDGGAAVCGACRDADGHLCGLSLVSVEAAS